MSTRCKKILVLLLSLAVISSVFFLFAGRKEGFFIDEIYTYGLSNSYYAPFVTDLKGGDMTDKVFTREELMEYLTVGEDDAFAFDSVFYNQGRDVHPPLYYCFFHLTSSLIPNVFSVRTGLLLNYVFLLLSLLTLWKLSELLFDSISVSACAVLLYGLSVMALSTALLIRMYMLLTLEGLILSLLITLLIKKKAWWQYPAVALTILAGMLTQYYFVFFAFFLCLGYVIYALIHKEYKSMLIFSGCALAGVAGLLLVFPAFLTQVSADVLVSGGSAVNNLLDISQYAARLSFYIWDSLHRMKGIAYTAAAAAIVLLILFGRVRTAVREKRLDFTALYLILPAFAAFFLIALISPVLELRYVYGLIPMFALAAAGLLYMIETTVPDGKKAFRIALPILAAALSLWEARCLPPDWLFDEYREYDAKLLNHSDAQCVYIDDNFYSPITYDMEQLLTFDDLLVTNDPASEALRQYIGSSPETVVFIDISKDWASGYDSEEILPELMESTGYTASTPLYSNGFSDVYLLSK